MSQYSVDRVLGWRNLMTAGTRDEIHDPVRSVLTPLR